ncbi:hypothetical protein VFPPC_03853 [Pochonia chlamydosporia 170]|uniref:Uncharacterized protein n=1 Tax=Pochonia chlamydosporia 170 TaxID=1380566 RepID=A0A179F3C3_METCM|nr:hypothetical protein VFPPC_03853 [Pochonia chlamydosporia 170]OAQ59639.1 hypothetical protein VFPPC_03853 [Pochonia chlamydosporia 170]
MSCGDLHHAILALSSCYACRGTAFFKVKLTTISLTVERCLQCLHVHSTSLGYPSFEIILTSPNYVSPSGRQVDTVAHSWQSITKCLRFP